MRGHARFAAFDGSRVLRPAARGAVAALRAVVADRGADDRAGDGCGVVAAAAAELVADHAADDRAHEGAHAAARNGPLNGVVLGLLPALAYRRVHGDVANDRLRADHARVVVLGSRRLRGNHGEQRSCDQTRHYSSCIHCFGVHCS